MIGDNHELVPWAIRELVSQRVLVQRTSSERYRADGVVHGTSLRVEALNAAMKSFEARVIRRAPSDLALDVGIGSFFRSATQFSVGDPALDEALCRGCAPGCEAQAAKLFDGAAMRRALVALVRCRDFVIADDAVIARFAADQATSDELIVVLESLVAVASELDARSPSLGPPASLVANDVAESLSRAAVQRGLSVREHPFEIEGRGERCSVRMRFVTHVATRREGDPLWGSTGVGGFDAELTFDEPLVGAISLRPARWKDRLLARFGLATLRTSNREFNAAWRLECDDRSAIGHARAQFTEEAVRSIEALRSLGIELWLGSAGASARGPVLSNGRDAERVVNALTDLRSTIRLTHSKGAYR
jgi:hypothetical protein